MLAALLVSSVLSTSCAHPAGTRTLPIDAGGLTREVVLVVGSEVKGPAPVVFAWHGFGGSPEDLVHAVAPDTLWKDAIVVLPRGLGRTFPQFGDVERPGFQVRSGELGDRDVKLFDTVYARLQKDGCLDGKRVYSTGFSNGGFMSNLLGCVRATKLAAIAPVGGGGPFEKCSGGVAVRVSHGTADNVVPFAMAQGSVEKFSELNACTHAPSPADNACAVSKCKGDVEIAFCSAPRGHQFGGAAQSREIAAFFRAHVRR